MPNIWSVHRDPEFWGPDADVYRPERHLNAAGKFAATGHVIAFGMGRRKCGGYALAMRYIVSVVASLLHRFHITLIDDAEVANDGESVLIYSPPEFEVRLTARN